MGIKFEILTENKSSILNLLIDILVQAEERGVQIYEEDEYSTT
jgi:hypothetical protein